MRLSVYQVQVIKYAVHDCFGHKSAVFLFGSRTNDQAKGGDIDLFVKTNLEKDEAQQAQVKLQIKLQQKLGEQKIDLVVQAADDIDRPIFQEAQNTGIKL